MAVPPEIFVIGAQKAGTTTLASLLDRHPQVTLSTPKEPHFFTSNWSKGFDWYRGVFRGPPENICVDASTSNAAGWVEGVAEIDASTIDDHPRSKAAERIFSVRPDAKFIYILRDPVYRTYSSYWHEVRAGRERRSFRDAFLQSPSYLSTSLYIEQLKKYLCFFSMDRFLFLTFEEMRTRPVETVNTCFHFMGLSEIDIENDVTHKKNPSYEYTPLGTMAARVASAANIDEWLTRVIKRTAPEKLQQILTRTMTKSIPPMNESDAQWLTTYFFDHNRDLEKQAGVSLDRWRHPPRNDHS